MDDVEVGREAVPAIVGTTDGLYIGGGSTLAPGTFWQGLTDDVRIYNRIVAPESLVRAGWPGLRPVLRGFDLLP